MITTYTVNAFTKNAEGGNPAGVVINETALSESEMQKIASKLGFSETAFIQNSTKDTQLIRFFTPQMEVDLCGHATIASYFLLGEMGKINPGNYVMKTRAGNQDITYESNGRVTMTQNNPEFGKTIDAVVIAESLGLKAKDFHDSLPVQIASTGLYKIFAPIKDLKSLDKLKPDYGKIKSISENHGAIGIYAYTLETLHDSTAHCRNFSPVVGINEDAATGTSAAALSCVLFKYGKVNPEEQEYLTFEQGYKIGSPSEIIVKLGFKKNIINKVRVAGEATIIDKKDIEI